MHLLLSPCHDRFANWIVYTCIRNLRGFYYNKRVPTELKFLHRVIFLIVFVKRTEMCTIKAAQHDNLDNGEEASEHTQTQMGGAFSVRCVNILTFENKCQQQRTLSLTQLTALFSSLSKCN